MVAKIVLPQSQVETPMMYMHHCYPRKTARTVLRDEDDTDTECNENDDLELNEWHSFLHENIEGLTEPDLIHACA